ncbi:MAG: 1,4-alpha-glucan branching protein GlgB [Mariniblastus sp.]|nr:1,4-alpha-glucan branching protein GlgB [Mariniblastus sp.]
MAGPDPDTNAPYLSDEDLYLLGEGNQYRLYDHLGAHPHSTPAARGIRFAVWAPNASEIQVVGDFNQWDGSAHRMQKRTPSGVWELFVPDLELGNQYKYRVTDSQGNRLDKCDPLGFFAEVPPGTANIVVDLDQYAWNDREWVAQRPTTDWLNRPISIYEVHLGSWRQRHDRENGWINYRELAQELVDYARTNGFTHLELLPIAEHPFSGSWGYQTVGYYAPTSRFGRPEDLMYFVDLCHQNGIGVIIDWVPAHFPRDSHGLARFDGTALYEHEDPRQGEHPDWDTLIFNYGRNEVRNFLVANALFWLDKYHIDGLRVDAVASMLYLDYSRPEGEWLPNEFGGRENLAAIEFLKQMNDQVQALFPGSLTIAEESTAWGGVSRPTYCGGLGFSMKWNMGWMNDTLRYLQKEPVHRQYHHDELTFSLVYAFTENFVLPLSHDEVVHEKGSMLAKMPGDTWQQFANLRLLYTYMWAHPGKKLLFMGSEFGQWSEWNCDLPLQWELLEEESHAGLQKLVSDLNQLYQAQPELHASDFEADGFTWLNADDRENSVLSFQRTDMASGNFLLAVCNFTPAVRTEYRVGVPLAGQYLERLNSDSEFYGGSNVGNGLGIHSEPIPCQGQPHSIAITLPPLGALILQPAAT